MTPRTRPVAPARRRGLFRVMSVALALLVFIPFGELCIRVVLTLSYRNTLDQIPNELVNDPARKITFGRLIQLDPDPKLVYRMRPGTRAIYSSIKTEINSMGFRDDEITTAKPARTLRVLGLGDSSMFGLGVFRQQSYMDLLENEFRNLLRNRWNVQFVNTGTPGYNTTQEVELFLNSGLKLDPDAVVIQFDRNDLNAPVGIVRPDYLFARHFFMAHLPSLAQGEYSDLRAFYLLDQQDRMRDLQGPGSGWQAVVEGYRRLAAVCRERKIPLFGLLVFEDAPRLTDKPAMDPIHRQILDLWRELGITAIQALPAIQAQHARDRNEIIDFLISPNDPHPNPAGHALIAQSLLPALCDILLKKAGLSPDQLDQYPALGNILLRQSTGTGLHQTEIWDGYTANWTGRQAHLHFLPAGRKVVIPLMISHPDVSAAKPVEIKLRIDGVPTARHPVATLEDSFSATTAGYTKRTLDISGMDGCPLELTVTVNRTFHTATDPRPLGVGIYEFSFIP